MLPELSIRVGRSDDASRLAVLATPVKFDTACPEDKHASTELQTLYVQEHFIGQGVGKLLLRAAETGARQQQANAMLWLTVNAKNTRAAAFYAHQGYTKVGTTYFTLGEGRHENHVLIGPNAQA